MQESLEREFSEQMFRHKAAVIYGSLLKFYEDEYNTGINIPKFLDCTPIERAKVHFYNLLNNKEKFEDIYNKCWEQIKEFLP